MTLSEWQKIPPTDRKRIRRTLRKLGNKLDVIERTIFDFISHRFSTPYGDIVNQGLYVEYDFTNTAEPNPTVATDAFVDAIDIIEASIRDDFFVEQKSVLIGNNVKLDTLDDVSRFTKSLVPEYNGKSRIFGSPENFANNAITSIGKRVVVDPGSLPDVTFRIEFNEGHFYLLFPSVDPELLSTLNIKE